MVEYKLPKLGVAGSTPVARSSRLKVCVWLDTLFEVVNLTLRTVNLLRIADLALNFSYPCEGLYVKRRLKLQSAIRKRASQLAFLLFARIFFAIAA